MKLTPKVLPQNHGGELKKLDRGARSKRNLNEILNFDNQYVVMIESLMFLTWLNVPNTLKSNYTLKPKIHHKLMGTIVYITHRTAIREFIGIAYLHDFRDIKYK